MIPMQWCANVNLPYYGWTGRDDFVCVADARAYVAQSIRQARRETHSWKKPWCVPDYVIRPLLLRNE